jgi:integrase
MSILDFNVTRNEWLEGVENKSKSYNSFYAHSVGIKKWDLFLESINHTDKGVLQELKRNNDNPDTYRFLNRYIQWLNKQGLKRSTIDLNFAVLRSWCAANGVMLFNEYVKRFVNLPKSIREIKPPLTPEIIKLLINNSSKNVSTILLILLSSGMRIGECLHLQVRDIDVTTNPIQIKIRAATTKSRQERIAYISSEAWAALKPLLLNKEPEDLIFIAKYTKASLISFEMQFGRLRKKLNLTDKYDDGRNYHVNIHAFRAYFHTQATKVLGGDIGHALLGHRKYLDMYLRLSVEEKSEMYHKLEPYITVSDEMRQKGMLQEKDRQIIELQSMKDELNKQKAKIKRLEESR